MRLDPPDDGDAWHLAVFASGPKGELMPIEHAIVNAGSEPAATSKTRPRASNACCPRSCGPGGMRRGQVILSQDEAWELMTETGPQLVAAGFDVRVPALSLRKPSPSLRVFVDETSESVVGANQLANVRWSAVFDDVELTAADIAAPREGSAPAHPFR